MVSTWTPSSDPEVVAELEQFEKDTLYLAEHQEEWLEELADCWVVVYREELVAHSATLEQAMAAAEVKGCPVNLAAVELITSKPRTFIL